MAEQFYTILTEIGKAKIANAVALGNTVQITQIAVGDGNGNYYNPSETQTALVNEVWRGNISRVEPDPNNPNWIVVEAVIPPDQGGFYIREVGIFDSAGDLIAVGKYPETYKPTFTANNAGKDLVIRCILEVSNASAVELKVDPTTVIATVQSVEDRIAQHDQDPNAHSGILTQLSDHMQNTAIHTPVVTPPQVSGLTKIKYGNTLTLIASGSKTAFRDEGASITEYEWILPDNTTQVTPADTTESATLSYQIPNDPNLVGTTYTFKVRARDSFGNVSDWTTHDVLISDNTPPIIDSVNWYEADGTTPASTFYEGQTYRVEIIASDLENDPLSYSLTFTDPNVSVTDLGGGWFEVTFPFLTTDSTYDYSVSVSDGVDTTTETYSIDVLVIKNFETIYDFTRHLATITGIYKDGYIYALLQEIDTAAGRYSYIITKLTRTGDVVWAKRLAKGDNNGRNTFFWCNNQLVLIYIDGSTAYVVFVDSATGNIVQAFSASFAASVSILASVFQDFFYVCFGNGGSLGSGYGIYKFSLDANGQWFVEESFTDGIQDNVIFLDPNNTGAPTQALHINVIQDSALQRTEYKMTVSSYDGVNFTTSYEASLFENSVSNLLPSVVYGGTKYIVLNDGSKYALSVDTSISYTGGYASALSAVAHGSKIYLGYNLIIDQNGTPVEYSNLGTVYVVDTPPSEFYALNYSDQTGDGLYDVLLRKASEPLASSYSACTTFGVSTQTLSWTSLTSTTPSQTPAKSSITNPFSAVTLTPTDETPGQVCFTIV